jgi:hypothetical protein
LAGTQRDSDSFCVAVLVGSERTNSLAAGYASLARRDGRVRPAWAYSGRWRRAHGHDSSLRGAASGWAGPSLAPTRPPRPWPQPMWSCERLGWAFTRARHGRRSCVRPTQRGPCCEAPRSAGAIGGRSRPAQAPTSSSLHRLEAPPRRGGCLRARRTRPPVLPRHVSR